MSYHLRHTFKAAGSAVVNPQPLTTDTAGANPRGKQTHWPAGQIVRETFSSKILAGNPLGDPHERTLTLWLPPDYNRRKRALPVLFDLVGFTGAGPAHTNWNAFTENVPERLDRLHHAGKLGSCIVVFPDCYTALGGNQYINSSAIGRYADYLTKELIPFVDKHFNTLADREHRGCFGKSSGGYGALIHGMRYNQYWGAIACHSGDAAFDLVYGAEWPAVITHLSGFAKRARVDGPYRGPSNSTNRTLAKGIDDGRIQRFLDYHWQNERPSGDDIMCLMLLAMAASYDADPKVANGFRVPFHLETGQRLESRWRRWQQQDPINLVATHASALKSLRGIYLDCGWQDQYHIHFGARQLSAQLHKHKVPHRYEEFAGTHSGIDHRMDRSLPALLKALR